ncbi:hypothetical protein EK21DRAFT_93651 [Setomelanomma holmii]|uniref:Uncharacterized protein n=1 Tax=Setomelanomma holmii TaxID=210430 RepID=A0A9P4LHV6_9PLEO|nr:hypothetical protein EK21DRAFT_93651 [Setomelanomma holmii]
MDITATPPRRSRYSIQQHRQTQDSHASIATSEERNIEGVYPRAALQDLSLAQKERRKKRVAMTKDHRFYHRRQAQAATRVLTVNVEVIATVDTSGNLVGQETKTADADASTPAAIVDTLEGVVAPVVSAVQSVAAPVASPIVNIVDSVAAPVVSAVVNAVAPSVVAVPSASVPAAPSLPQVPSVPPFPTAALPSVPSVPAFPSDLVVPSYPFGSGASALAAAVSTGHVTPSPAPTSVLGSSVAPASLSTAAPLPASNSTIVSTPFLSSASIASLNSASISLSGSQSFSVDPSGRSSTLSSDETASSRLGSATASPGSGTTLAGGAGAGGGGAANTAPAPGQATSAAGTGTSGNSTPLETPQVVGSVVGSLAGAALILAIILLLLRRHKRKRRGALQLTGDETAERTQPMIQDTSRSNRIPSAFLNRFSGLSRSTAETSASGGERSFQRVSGRKLPSAFSEGMTSEQFSRGGTMSGSSFYQDDQGTYGGPGFAKELDKEIGGGSAAAGTGMMNIRPSPARTPVIRHPDDDLNPFADPTAFTKSRTHLSPPQSPNPDIPRSSLGRSLQSADGSRSSKFTENV